MSQDEAKSAMWLRWAIALWLVVLIWAMFPYTREPTAAIKTLVLRVGAAGLFIGGIWSTRDRRDRGEPILPLLVAGFVAIQIVAVFGAVNPLHSANAAHHYLALAFAFFAARRAYRTAEGFWSTVAVVACGLAVTSLYGFAQYFGWDPMPWDMAIAEEYGYLQQGPSTFGNPNFASHALLPAVILVAGWTLATRRYYGAVPLIVFALHFSLTRTRGSLLALACAALFVVVAVFVARRVQAGWKSAAYSIAGTLAIIIATAAVVSAYSTVRYAAPIPHDPTVAIRVQTLAGATAMARDRPLLGWGPGSYAIENPRYWTPDEQARFIETGAFNANVHSDWIETAIEGGIGAAALYLAVIAFGLVYALRIAFTAGGRSVRVFGYGAAAALAAFFVDGLFGFPLHTPVASALVFVLLGAVSGITGAETPAAERWRGRRIPVMAAVILTALAALGAATGVFRFGSQVYEAYGRASRDAGRLGVADRALQRAAILAPYDWDIPYLHGNIAMARGNSDHAVSHYERALSLNPHFAYAHLELAKVYLHRASALESPADLRHAIASANSAASYVSEWGAVHDLLGRAYALDARWGGGADAWERAEAALSKAVQFEATPRAQSWRLIADTRLARGGDAGAARALVAALEAAPEDERTWQRLERLAEESGEWRALAQAVAWRVDWLRDAKRLGGEHAANVFLRQARVRTVRDDPPNQIVAAYGSAITAAPVRPATWEAFWEWAESADQVAAFLQQLRRIARNRDGDLPYGLTPAGILARGGEGALPRSVEALAEALDRAWPQSQMARVKIGLRVSAAYIEDAAEARASGELLMRARLTAGRAFLVGDEPERALAVYARAAESASGAERIDALLGKAFALSVLERYDDATDALREATELNPRRIDVRLALAGAYFDAERWAEARLEYAVLLNALGRDDPLREQIQEQLRRIDDAMPR